MTDFFLTARALTDLLGPISAPENLTADTAEFAFGTSMTLLPGSLSLQFHMRQDDNNMLDDRAFLLHSVDLHGVIFPEGSWLRPQFQVALRKSPLVLTIWRMAVANVDEGENTLFTTTADLKPGYAYQIDPLDA